MRKFWRFSKKTIRVTWRCVRIAVAFFVIVFGLAFWYLSVSPVDVGFIVPTLQKELMPSGQFELKTKGAFLQTAFSRKGFIQIRIFDLTVAQPDGTVVTRLPEVDLSYGMRKLLTLNVIPDTVELQKPAMHFVVDETGNLNMFSSDAGGGGAPIELSPERFVVLTQTFTSFRKIEVKSAQITWEDVPNRVHFQMPDFNLSIARSFAGKVALTATGTAHLDKTKTPFDLTANLNRFSGKGTYKLSVNHISLPALDFINPALADMKLDLNGVFQGEVFLKKYQNHWRDILGQIVFKIQSERAGTLCLPAPLTANYPIQSLLVQGEVAEQLQSISIMDSQFVLSSGPVADVSVDVLGIDDYFKTNDLNQIKTTLQAVVKNTPVDVVPDVWPSALGPDGHAWVKKNLRGGMVTQSIFALYFTGAELVDLTGDLDVEGATVDYLAPMPKITNVNAKVYLYPDDVNIFATAGQIDHLKLVKADLYLSELNSEVGKAKMQIQVSGPVEEAMALIDAKPLEFAQAFGINPKQTAGTGEVDVSLSFPLSESIEVSDVQTKVTAQITDAVFPVGVNDYAISQGQFDLTVTNKGLSLKGTARLLDNPFDITWNESFDDTIKPVGRYQIKGIVSDAFLKQIDPTATDYVTGEVPVQLFIDVNTREDYQFNLTADLTPAEVHLYPISFSKNKGNPMSLLLDFKVKKGKMAYPILFKMMAPDEKTAIHIKADVSRGTDIIFDKVQTPGNNFTGRYVKNDKGDVTLNLKGSMLNMAEIFDMPLFKRETQRTADADQKSATQTKPVTVPDLTFDIRLDTLTLKKNEPLTNVRVSGKRRGLYWQSLSAYLLANKPLSVNFTPETKILNGSTEDFGDVLNRLGVSERVRGGKLYFELTQRKNTGVMTGNLQVKNFEIGQTGFLTQALTILGIVDAIRGKELSFKKAIVPLTIMPAQSIKITEGYMYGTAVGITFDGTVTREKLNLSGSVIPAYAINSLPGKIPFIGQIFKNGAGGGLMGLKYEVTGGLFSPIVTFNPLASVAPGILGKLFN